MGIEIERKYLVVGDSWRKLTTGVHYRQGYLNSVKERVVRIRIINSKAYLTVKGLTVGISRNEFEYEIPVKDAEFMLSELCEKPIIDKHRYTIPRGKLIWEVDEFHGENRGLIIAEVELTDPQQKIEKPEWIGQEISDDPRYYNTNLAIHPYSKW